jgi:hypothetical protein
MKGHRFFKVWGISMPLYLMLWLGAIAAWRFCLPFMSREELSQPVRDISKAAFWLFYWVGETLGQPLASLRYHLDDMSQLILALIFIAQILIWSMVIAWGYCALTNRSKTDAPKTGGAPLS